MTNVNTCKIVADILEAAIDRIVEKWEILVRMFPLLGHIYFSTSSED